MRLSAILAFTFVIFFTANIPAYAGNCGNGNGGGSNSNGCPPNKHNVPAPVAGIGLPFLIVGVIAYKRRRKSDINTI